MAAPRSRKAASPPPNHARQWALGIAATLLATAVIQGVRMWADADAYDTEVAAMLDPIQQQAVEAKLGVGQIAKELELSRLQNRRVSLEQDIYELERAHAEDTERWNARDDLRLKELHDQLDELTDSMKAQGVETQ